MNDRPAYPRLVSIGTANPSTRYTQQQELDLFRCDDHGLIRFFQTSHIRTRHLVLPTPDADGNILDENGTILLKKHLDVARVIGLAAVVRCLEEKAVLPGMIDAFIAVTTTGFLCPSLTAHLAPLIGLRPNVKRVDIAGMGCNAGLNGLTTTAQFATAAPGARVLLLSCEVCSAAYVFDKRANTGVVNSLFGDGAAAVLVQADTDLSAEDGPQLIDSEPFEVYAGIELMRFDMENGRFNFYLDKDIPYLIGENISTPINALLSRNGLHKRDIAHWLVHSGGKKVVDSIKYFLGLTEHDVRHTRSILRDYGNLSSASVLFSYRELQQEGITRAGDWGVMMAMGPGVSLETILLRW